MKPSCAWLSCNRLESTQTTKEVGVPSFTGQEKRLRLEEVKEHSPDLLPIIQNHEMAFWGNSRLLWVQMIQMFASILQKGLGMEAKPGYATTTPTVHLTEISSQVHICWSEVLAQVPSFLVIQLI